jgi:hypothetical protein
MFRSILSIVVVASCLAVLPSHAGAAQQKAPAQSVAKTAATNIININTASAGELDGLPGVGAKTAARIVEYRQKNGRIAMTGIHFKRTHDRFITKAVPAASQSPPFPCAPHPTSRDHDTTTSRTTACGRVSGGSVCLFSERPSHVFTTEGRSHVRGDEGYGDQGEGRRGR